SRAPSWTTACCSSVGHAPPGTQRPCRHRTVRGGGRMDAWLLSMAESAFVYPGMFVLAVLDGFFPPVPSEVAAVALAALAAASGTPHLGLVLLFAASGAYVGDLIAYAIGSRIDVHRLPFLRRGRGRRTLAWAERSLRNGGSGFILAARFLPVARVAVNMAAGAL